MKLSLKHQLFGAVVLSVVGVLAAGCAAGDVNGSEENVSETSSELRPEWATSAVTVRHDIGSTDFKTLKVAKNDGFDRSVFQFSNDGVPGYDVRYVPNPQICAGEGEVEVQGTAFIQVQMIPANSYDPETQKPTYSPATIVDVKPNLASVKELKMTCPGFEAETTYTIGLSKKKNFRVLELKNPPRLVVDVQQ
ncbi:hypothetical protein LZC95_32975 [Pendulispora brunnea]|uniref:AMIN-like domain-containing protein n=1 Tax=Pendulispora brunnea TaxID=2905690 RepID=A0ABZ2JY32_9BACT